QVMTALVLLLSSLAIASATLGIDAEQAISTSTFTCLKSNSYSFYISRVYRSNGSLDNTGVQNIKNAWAAGLKKVYAYIFPCHSSSFPSAADQVIAAINAVKNGGTKIEMLWLDIEIYN
ncbi:hypothetical protein PENTCL1PPCAC_13460, partial [Pristionchus entomophagus]